MKRLMVAVLMVVLGSGSALAGKYDIELPASLGNDTFGTLVREAGILSAYRGVAPAEPGGITGFDLGVESSFVKVDSSTWDQVLAFGNTSAPSYLAVPRLHVRKGLPFNLDVGASYATVPGSNIKVLGGEVQWAPLEGSTATPALAVRGHYSTLQGVDDLSLSSYGADVVVSKGILLFTPYVGGGMVQIDGSYDGTDPTLQANLQDQSFTETRVFGGVQIAMALIRVTLDVEYSRMPVYTAKVSLGW